MSEKIDYMFAAFDSNITAGDEPQDAWKNAVQDYYNVFHTEDNGGCECQNCGRKYKIDVVIPDDLWELIKPSDKPEGAGMYCGICIMERIEGVLGDRYNSFELVEIIR